MLDTADVENRGKQVNEVNDLVAISGWQPICPTKEQRNSDTAFVDFVLGAPSANYTLWSILLKAGYFFARCSPFR